MNLIVAGDFNSTDAEAPCLFLREGHLPAGYRDDLPDHEVATKEAIEHPFALQDVYAEAHASPPYTRNVDGRGARLDFLWASQAMGLAAVLRPLPQDLHEERMANENGLPNERMPSDHLPVGAVLSLGPSWAAAAAAQRDLSTPERAEVGGG